MKMVDALQSASESLGSDNVKVKPAASSNPGVPPSSLMSFLGKVKPQISINITICLIVLHSICNTLI